MWYKAHEVFFRPTHYSFETDVWSAGCLFAEMVIGRPLFQGDSEIKLQNKIYTLLGSPTPEVMNIIKPGNTNAVPRFPEWKQIDIALITGSKQDKQQVVEAYLPERPDELYALRHLGQILGATGIDLLKRMLDLNPSTRISVGQALLHPYFSDLNENKNKNVLPTYSIPETQDPIAIKTQLLHIRDTLMSRYTPTKQVGATILRDGYGELTNHMFMVLADWLLDVQVHLKLKLETVHIAFDIIRRALASEGFKVNQ